MPSRIVSTRWSGPHCRTASTTSTIAAGNQFTGVLEGSTDGEAWNGVFHPDDQEQAWEVWRHCLATGAPYHIEYRLRHHTGEYRWVLGRAQPVRDKLGRIIRWYGTCTDIHALTTAQNALTESEARFRTLIDVSPQVVWFGDAGGAITYCNAYWYDYTGLEPGDTSGDGWVSVIHPDHRERVLAAWKPPHRTPRLMKSRYPSAVHQTMRTAGSSHADDPSETQRGQSSSGSASPSTSTSASKLRRLVRGLRPSCLRQPMPSSVSLQRRVIYRRGMRVLRHFSGTRKPEAIGGPATLLVPEEGLTASENEKGIFDLSALKAHGKADIESIRRCKDGRILDVSITATWVIASDGRALGVAGIFRDITARKQTDVHWHQNARGWTPLSRPCLFGSLSRRPPPSHSGRQPPGRAYLSAPGPRLARHGQLQGMGRLPPGRSAGRGS